MKTIMTFATAAVLTGAITVAAVTPSQARDGRNAAAIGGFAVGAIVGAAAASAANRNYYGPGYYYSEPAYVYERGYAYEPEPVYVEPRYAQPRYTQPMYRGGCWVSTDSDERYGYWGSCATPGARPVR